MRRPRLSWPLPADVTLAALGLVAVTGGAWLQWGPGIAALVFGGILLADAVAGRLRSARGGDRS